MVRAAVAASAISASASSASLAGQVVAVAAEVVQVGLGGILTQEVAEPGGQVAGPRR